MENSQKLIVNGGYPLHTFEEVEEIYLVYISNKQDRDNIRKAYEYILKKHNGIFRKSGEPYYHHLIEVAYILATLHSGPSTIIAGLLHDVVEDTDTPIEEIESIWGTDVAKIVDSLTKIQRLKLSKFTREEFEAQDHRKIFLGMAKDIRVILIKLADRLHNMRTLGSLSQERQKTLSFETMEVFVPIAHRLGLEGIRSELADLCLKYSEPTKYNEIIKLLSKKSRSLKKSLDTIKKRIADILFENNIPFEISSRVKSVSSIYNKIYKNGHTFDEIYDILALRIVTDNEMRCYEILGLIHKTYTPVPGRFKDYIAMPKQNLYQSLHTTIVSGDGNFYEVQIRTEEMDKVAETGVASHWAYKEGAGYNPKDEQKEIENKLHWFRDFVSISNENENIDASEYVDNLTKDIFDANVYVFTPKGKVLSLPNGATVVDFAFHIHSKVGETMTGAIVNGIMVPINTILKTGDIIEIKTQKNAPGPNETWIEYAKTNSTKSYVKKFLQKKNAELLKEERIAKGKTLCIDAFAERDINEAEMMNLLSSEKVLKEYEVETVDDLFFLVSGRKPTAPAIIEFLGIEKKINIDEITTKNKEKAKNKTGKLAVECKGAKGIAINLANCCSPIPGDEIVGYITKGKGISVHRKNCPNIINETDRLVEVYWTNNDKLATYPVDVLVEANDRQNLLLNILTILTNAHINVSNIHGQTTNNGTTALISLTILVADARRLTEVTNIILNINGVYKVTRLIH